MWYKHNFFKYVTGIILCLLVIFLFGKIEYFLSPFRTFVVTLFFPFLISGVFYYMLRPIVRWLVRRKVSRNLSIAIVLVVASVLCITAGVYAISLVVDQLTQMVRDFPDIIDSARKALYDASYNPRLFFIPFDLIQEQLVSLSQKLILFLPNSVLGFLSALTNVATVLLLVPFIIFYLLKDDHIFAGHMLKVVPFQHRENGQEILEDIDRTLSAYIVSQIILALFLGVLMYIGYLIVGLKYSFILALFAAITSIIPIVGSILGIVPALLVGLGGGPLVLLKIIILMAIAQTVQNNIVTPLIMGKNLDIHPLTYIIVFLVSSAIFGFIGMLIAVPVYAVLKVTLEKLLQIYRLRKLS